MRRCESPPLENICEYRNFQVTLLCRRFIVEKSLWLDKTWTHADPQRHSVWINAAITLLHLRSIGYVSAAGDGFFGKHVDKLDPCYEGGLIRPIFLFATGSRRIVQPALCVGRDVAPPVVLRTRLIMDLCARWQMPRLKRANDVWLRFICAPWKIARSSVICERRVSHLRPAHPSLSDLHGFFLFIWGVGGFGGVEQLSLSLSLSSSFLIISLCLLQREHYSFQSPTHHPANPHRFLPREGQTSQPVAEWALGEEEGWWGGAVETPKRRS